MCHTPAIILEASLGGSGDCLYRLGADVRQSQGDGSTKASHCWEGHANACCATTPEERFMTATKDARPYELVDEEQAISLLLRHGFDDGRIHEILNCCESASSTRGAVAKIDRLEERRILLENRLREVTEKMAETVLPSRASSSAGDATSSTMWLASWALAAAAGAVVAAVAA